MILPLYFNRVFFGKPPARLTGREESHFSSAVLAAGFAIGADAGLGVVQSTADCAAQSDCSDGNAGTDDREDERIFSCRSAAVVTQERSHKITNMANGSVET